MAKGIIVVDVPERCGGCLCCDVDYDWCEAKNDCTFYNSPPPEWCPIKPMPEKKNPYHGRRPVPMNVIANQYYASGWNACIDELMGGSDGTEANNGI